MGSEPSVPHLVTLDGRPQPRINPRLRSLTCSRTGVAVPVEERTGPAGLCSCCPAPGSPLLCDYDHDGVLDSPSTGRGLGRWAHRLPVIDLPAGYVDDVGDTPVVPLRQLGDELGVELWAKLEAGNATGSFKDRGLSIAVALGVAWGAQRFMLPTQGNAGVAAAAFCARLECEPALVYMPLAHRGSYYHRAAQSYGAQVRFSGANIAQAGAAMRSEHGQALAAGQAVDLSTFFEPGRLEGKKTMGLEIVEQFAGRGPLDGIIYPTGGGTGLVGIARAFAESRDQAEYVHLKLPALIAVQAEGCAPVVDAFDRGDDIVTPVISQGTCADGLDVPGAIMGHGILKALRESGGHARRVSESAIRSDHRRLSSGGLDVGYEAAATLAGLRAAIADGRIKPGSRILLLLTGGGNPALFSGADS